MTLRASRSTDLDELREMLGRNPTRDEVRRLEVLAEFQGFNVREFLEGDRYTFIRRSGKATRNRYGLRHRPDCVGVSLMRRLDNGLDRCLGCALANARARASQKQHPHCEVCGAPFVQTPKGRKTCSTSCRYRKMAASRLAAELRTPKCYRGHRKTKKRHDGHLECRECQAIWRRSKNVRIRAASSGRRTSSDTAARFFAMRPHKATRPESTRAPARARLKA